MSNCTKYTLSRGNTIIESTEACHIEKAMEYFEELGYPVWTSEYTIGRVNYDPWDNWHPSYEFASHSVTTMSPKVEHPTEPQSEPILIGASGAYYKEGELRHSER